MTNPTRSLNARRVNVSAPPVSGIAAVPSAYDSATSEEDEARDEQDDGRQPERVRGDDPEREVDRGADLAVRDREQRRRVEHALEAADLAPAILAARPVPAVRSSWIRATPSATNRPPSTKPTTPPPCDRRDDEQRDADRDEHAAEHDRPRCGTSSRRAPLARRRHHHAARRVAHHAVDGRAEDAAAALVSALRGEPEHDDLGRRGARPRARSRPRRCGRARGAATTRTP